MIPNLIAFLPHMKSHSHLTSWATLPLATYCKVGYGYHQKKEKRKKKTKKEKKKKRKERKKERKKKK